MQLGVNYPSLRDMFGEGSTAATIEGMKQLQNAYDAQDQNMRAAQQDYSLNEQLNPIKVSQAQQNLDNDKISNEILQKQKLSALSKSEQQEFSDMMDRIGGAAAYYKANGSLPAVLSTSIHPEILQTLQQPGGADKLISAATAAKQQSLAWQKLQGGWDMKQGIAEKTSEDRQARLENALLISREQAASRERIAAQRLENARRLVADKRSTSGDKKTLEQYAKDLFAAADSIRLDEPDKAAILEKRGNEIFAKAASLRAASTIEGNAGKTAVMQELGIAKPGGPISTRQPQVPVQAPQQANTPADPYAGFKIK